MASFFLYGGTDWDSYDDIAGGTIIARNGRTLTYLSDAGFRVTLTGTGFRYDANGLPIAGSITQITVRQDGTLLAEYKSLTMALTAYVTLVLGPTPDMEAVYRDLRDGSDLIVDSALGRNLWGYDGDDTILGKDGDDWMSGGTGVDSFDGGTGLNGVRFDDATQGIRVNLSLTTGNVVNDGHGNTETATNIQMAEGGDFADRFTGSTGDNAFYGKAGDDVLIGDAGDDTLDGGAGKDALFGGDGIDTLTFFDVPATGTGVTVQLAAAAAFVIVRDGFGNTELASGFENVVGSVLNDSLAGNNFDNNLWGEDGNDSIIGFGGDDGLFGGDGNDILNGDVGDDYLDGGDGFDTFYAYDGFDILGFFSAGESGHGVRVDLYLTTKQVIDDGFGNAESVASFEGLEGSRFGDDFHGGYGHMVMWGLDGADTLRGGHGDDTIYGGLGNDEISGKFGSNTVLGGKGRDNIFCIGFSFALSGVDTLAFWDVDATGHGANVNLARATRQVIDDGYGNTETATGIDYLDGTDYADRFTGDVLHNVLWGNAGNDTLAGVGGDDGVYGGLGKDRLFGGAGFDNIVGGADLDVLTGGTEADYFYFMGATPGSDGVDTITDFASDDGIVINVDWAADLALGNLTAAQFRIGFGATTATNAAQRVIYDMTTGNLYFDADGTGSAATTLITTLSNQAVLTYDRVFTTEPF